MNGSWRLALGGRFMHRILALIAIVTVCGFAASAQTTDEIVAHYVKAVGGMDKDRKSTRLNSSHLVISYAVFCLKKKKEKQIVMQLTTLVTQEILASLYYSSSAVLTMVLFSVGIC